MTKLFQLVVLLLLSKTAFSISFVIDYASFAIEGSNPYLEIYLSVNGNSISYSNIETDNYQGMLEVTYVLEDKEGIIGFKKFQLNSPVYKASDAKLDIIDTKRIPVKNGSYNFIFKVKDLITGDSSLSVQQLEPINYIAESLSISDVLLANEAINKPDEQGDFIKNGYEIIPNFSHAYRLGENQFYFYAEIYNSNKNDSIQEAYLLEYKVVQKGTNDIVADLRHAKRQKAIPTTVILSSFDLGYLPSGDYELVINVINHENKLIRSKRVSFFQFNPDFVNYASLTSVGTFVDSITNIALMREYIKSLYPISSHDEFQFSQNQLKHADLELMQRYFLNFWKNRDPANPEKEWLNYKEKLELVDKEFGYGNVKGYQTERGRVYLQYGPPNYRQNVPYQADSYPYSIWQYSKLNGMTDRKFIFYSPSMEMLGYEILHSNVRGEVYNPAWETVLVNPTKVNSSREAPDAVFNDRARDLFNNPR